MAIRWKFYVTCWFLGASVQSAVFFNYTAVDYFNYFFPHDYKPVVYIGVTVGVGAAIGAMLTVAIQLKRTHLPVLLITQAISAVLLIAEVVIIPLKKDILSTEVRFALVLLVIFLATVIQNVGGGALYSFAGKHFPSFGIHAAQSGGVCAFAATFVIRCVSKGSFDHLKDRRKGYRLSGYLYVVLVDLIIVVACCLIIVLRNYSKDERASRLAAIDRDLTAGRETSPLLRSDDSCVYQTRRQVIRTNWTLYVTIFMTIVFTNTLFPGIASLFDRKHNCGHNSTNGSLNYTYASGIAATITTEVPTTAARHETDNGWFIVILFGFFSVADAVGKNLPILRIIYNKKTLLVNCLIQFVVAVPILLIYFLPCDSGLQKHWVAYFTLALLGLINGYGLCVAMMLLAPGVPERKDEEGQASSIGYMFLQVGILFGMSISVFLVDYIFVITKK